MEARVWTFQVVGGASFKIRIPNNPALSHDGSITLYHLVGTDTLADALQDILLASDWGCRVNRYAELETPEQTAYHQEYIESEASLFPCTQCVSCFWLDLHVDGYCGFDGWTEDVRSNALEVYPKAHGDAASCPVGKMNS